MNDLSNIERSTTFDRIEKYYKNSARLSEKDREICERWELGFALLLEHKNRKVAVSKLIALQKTKGKSLSTNQAYEDISNAENLFAPLRKYTKEFIRLVVIESALKDVRKAEAMAAKENDVKLWAEIMKVKDKAEKRIIEASGINLQDPNIPDFSKLEMNQFNIQLDPSIVNMMKHFISRGIVDVTEIFKTVRDNTEDHGYGTE